MAKKNKKDKEAKKARAEAKNKRNQQKAAAKNKKMMNKLNAQDSDNEDDVDLDTILAQFKLEQEKYEKINIETVQKPTKRINACMVANPLHSKREIILFGGEYTDNDTGKTIFYNDLYTFTKNNNQWKRYTSQNSPMPRSSAAMCCHSSGIALLHGGEFSSPKQSTFYHYNDTWILDTQSKEWTKIESKMGPSARSGHRITTWKNYFILFGGFRDLGSHTTYLDDTWIFDITTHKWRQLEFPKTLSIPDARSGHSFIPLANPNDGVLVYGGYCKIKAKKNLQKGKILTDYWVLKPTNAGDVDSLRWERRKRTGFQPSPRVGCSLAYHKGRGIMFGGVYDYDETEESMESEYYNDLFSYNVESNRWYNLKLRKNKNSGDRNVKSNSSNNNVSKEQERELQELLNKILEQNNLSNNNEDDAEVEEDMMSNKEDGSVDDSIFTVSNQLPHPRFNASLAVMNDSLYIYGGIWEYGDKDYIVDSFYSIDLNRVDCVTVYWEDLREIEQAKREGVPESDFEDEDDEDEEEDDSEEEIKDEKLVAENEDDEAEDDVEEEEEQPEMEIPDERPWLPHPKPFESLREFYIREGPKFLEWAISNNRDVRGKHLKHKSFELCQDRWWERRDQVRIEEEKLEEIGVTENVIERDSSKPQPRRR